MIGLNVTMYFVYNLLKNLNFSECVSNTGFFFCFTFCRLLSIRSN